MDRNCFRVDMLPNFWFILPAFFTAFTAAGLWVVYFIALDHEKVVSLHLGIWKGNGSLYPPFISVAGSFPPASCIFSEVMNLAAFVGFVIGILRYVQVKPQINNSTLNWVSLASSSFAFIGMTLVGNFQLFIDKEIHNIGTWLTFVSGVFFCWLQSFITLRVNLRNEGRNTAIARFLLSGSITLCLLLCVFFQSQYLYMQGAQSQWAMVMLFLIFMGTFVIEFRYSSFSIVCTDTLGHPVSLLEMSEVTHNQL
ncbi:transmembrane protein 150C [Pholidichthys leucotaenia]